MKLGLIPNHDVQLSWTLLFECMSTITIVKSQISWIQKWIFFSKNGFYFVFQDLPSNLFKSFWEKRWKSRIEIWGLPLMTSQNLSHVWTPLFPLFPCYFVTAFVLSSQQLLHPPSKTVTLFIDEPYVWSITNDKMTKCQQICSRLINFEVKVNILLGLMIWKFFELYVLRPFCLSLLFSNWIKERKTSRQTR